MQVRSLGLATDLMISGWSGEVVDRGGWLRIRTPAEPDFWFGNALVVPAPPPDAGAAWLDGWEATFAAELPGAAHRALSVDGDVGAGVEAAAAAAGWVMQRNVVSVATQLAPVATPAGLTVRPMVGEADWARVAALAVTSDAAEGPIDDRHRAFLVARTATKRGWVAAGRGTWWGAFAGDELVGSLGLVRGDDLGRYQDVVTHPAWRRRGVARALLAAAGVAAQATGVGRLVIIAMAGGDALRLYHAAGFVPAETLAELVRRPPA